MTMIQFITKIFITVAQTNVYVNNFFMDIVNNARENFCSCPIFPENLGAVI